MKPDIIATRRAGLIARAGAKLGLHARDLDYQSPMSPSETRALLDRRARASLGLSGDQFVIELRAGRLPDTSVVHGLAMLVGEESTRAR